MIRSLFDDFSFLFKKMKLNSCETYVEMLSNPEKVLIELFEKYGIDQMIDPNEFQTIVGSYKCIHIINVFLIGDLLLRQLYLIISERVISHDDIVDWRVISLAHDIGYTYEYSSTIPYTESLDYFCIENNLMNFFNVLSCKYLFNRKSYYKYYEYKVSKFKLKDHGIIGGLLFFNKYNMNQFNLSIIDISFIIATHNMFISKEETKEEYLSYGLDELVPCCMEFKKLPTANSKYGVLYIALCLFDTTEPVNMYNYINVKQNVDLLKELSYYIQNERFIIESNNVKIIDDIFLRINDICEWLNVKMIRVNKTQIVIELV